MKIVEDNFRTTEMIDGFFKNWGLEVHGWKSPNDLPVYIENADLIKFATENFHSVGRCLKILAPGFDQDRVEVNVHWDGLDYWQNCWVFFQRFEVEYWWLFNEFAFNWLSRDRWLRFSVGCYDDLNLLVHRNGKPSSEFPQIRFQQEFGKVPITLGEWHNLEMHIVRHPTNGIFQLWWDKQNLIDFRGVTTISPARKTWNYPVKHYGDGREENKLVYFDDILISTESIVTVPTSIRLGDHVSLFVEDGVIYANM